MAFDSVQVRFPDVRHNDSPFANTRVVPFVGSYFEILKGVVDDVKTEYFWFFANFMNLKPIDYLNYIPEQHEKDQIHVFLMVIQFFLDFIHISLKKDIKKLKVNYL